MIASDAVAALRPRPSGPPLRGRAPLRDGIIDGRLVGRRNTEQGTAGSTLSSPIRGLRLGAGATLSALKSCLLLILKSIKTNPMVNYVIMGGLIGV